MVSLEHIKEKVSTPIYLVKCCVLKLKILWVIKFI